MNLVSTGQRILILFFVALVLFAVLLLYAYYRTNPDVLSETDSVTVSTDIPHIITVQVKPESRIPPAGNDSIPITVEIRPVGSTTALKTVTITANSTGDAYLGVISVQDVPVGTYDIAIKGLSHLRTVFGAQIFNGAAVRTYTLLSPLLPAGDANPTADNYVNGMDIAYLTVNIYSNDLRADLTHDGIVNSLDYAALLKNVYAYGAD